ncbi:PDZ domain-containing protein 11-like [Anneissia japonica]|uniref:PDZ domain-containing protein 11-like n=1 Tax=Anneissia japonica TaxID=1529436 RepID=UPI001425A277|nr:PDZ domain-containing protein 11-like [Anneissia japonica]
MDDNDMVQIHLPPYEYPPPWIPPHQRRNHQDYESNLSQFLPRSVHFSRSRQTNQFGFHIKGGMEHRCGLYVSRVLQDSNAYRVGLRVGDLILTVNGYDFTDLDHDAAVQVLKESREIEMQLKYFPYGYDKLCRMSEMQQKRLDYQEYMENK